MQHLASTHTEMHCLQTQPMMWCKTDSKSGFAVHATKHTFAAHQQPPEWDFSLCKVLELQSDGW